jgi:hypothetical protein
MTPTMKLRRKAIRSRAEREPAVLVAETAPPVTARPATL